LFGLYVFLVVLPFLIYILTSLAWFGLHQDFFGRLLCIVPWPVLELLVGTPKTQYGLYLAQALLQSAPMITLQTALVMNPATPSIPVAYYVCMPIAILNVALKVPGLFSYTYDGNFLISPLSQGPAHSSLFLFSAFARSAIRYLFFPVPDCVFFCCLLFSVAVAVTFAFAVLADGFGVVFMAALFFSELYLYAPFSQIFIPLAILFGGAKLIKVKGRQQPCTAFALLSILSSLASTSSSSLCSFTLTSVSLFPMQSVRIGAQSPGLATMMAFYGGFL